MKKFLSLFILINSLIISQNRLIDVDDPVVRKKVDNSKSVEKFNIKNQSESSSALIKIDPRIREDYVPKVLSNDDKQTREWCGTMPYWEETNPSQRSCDFYGSVDYPEVRDGYIPQANDQIIYIRVVIHAFGDDSGNNITTTIADAEAQIYTLNEAFIDQKVQFVPYFQSHNSSEFQTLTSEQWFSGEIKQNFNADPTMYHNIYIVDTDPDWGILGVSTFPWASNALTIYGGTLIDKDWFGGPRFFNNTSNVPQRTIVHEIGHALGLWHTHHGVTEVDECGDCYEGADGYVYNDGDNADVVGDFCSDTKGTIVNYTCADPEGGDCQGNTWTGTDVHNYMGYADDDCYNINNQGFTSQQSGRIRGWIADKYDGIVINQNENLLLSTGFEEIGFPEGWDIYDVDNDDNTWFNASESQNPGFDLAHYGDQGALIFSGSSYNNDYMVSPVIDIPSDINSCTFSFWAKSHNPDYLDDLVPRISTDGENFESLGAVYDTPSDWTNYTIDISSYAGQSIYLAIQCISVYGHYLFIDDFEVEVVYGDPPLDAEFSANTTSGPLPLLVEFTDLSSGSPTDLLWDFGDGNTSIEQNPTHEYFSGGIYTVSLTVTKDGETDTETKTNYITVGSILSEDFSSGIPSDWTIVNVNNDEVFWQLYSESSSSGADLAYSGDYSAGITYSAAGNNDWLITKECVLPNDNNITFSFWARSFDPEYLEDFNILISNAGNDDLTNFVTVASVSNVPNEWTQYNYNLTYLSGTDIHIAIQSVSVNEYYLFVDDFLIENSALVEFQPQSKQELQTAVNLWVSDSASAISTYGEINSWNVTLVTDMSSLFQGATSFNSDISGWNVSNVTDMTQMFEGATNFNADISGWNSTIGQQMFQGATSFNRDLSGWSVAPNLYGVFYNATSFNGDISDWDVSNVNHMSNMFNGASSFNGDISGWDVSNVNDMSRMFKNATSFNGDISNWHLGINCYYTEFMFDGATSFNGDISGWNVIEVNWMHYMFKDATSFNQDISTWNVSTAENMTGMFEGAIALSEEFKCAIQTSFSPNPNWPYNWCLPVLHVSTAGSDETGDGSEGNPFATIQKGIDTAIDGDTVLVASGTYVENIDYNNKQLVVASHFLSSDENEDFISNTIIDGDSTASCVTINAVGSELIGFTLTNGFSNDEGKGGAISVRESSTISHCLIINNFSDQYGTPILIWYTADDSVAFNYLTVFDNYNLSNGINNGIVWLEPLTTDVINISNTIFGGFEQYGGEQPIQNFVNNYSYNEVPWDAYSPFFCDPENGDYTLAENSPCVSTVLNGVNIGAFGVGCEAIILAPVLTEISDHQIEEDGDLIIDINATSDIGASMTFYAESDTSSVIAFVEYAALIVTPEPDWYGTANVTVIVTDENGLSDTTEFTLTVTAVNDSPEAFTVIYPTVSDTFSTHVDYDTTIPFKWQESYDVDSDVTYKLTIELEFFGNTYTDVHENITDTTISVSSNSLDALLGGLNINESILTYIVEASDEEYTIQSNAGTFFLSRASLGTINKDIVPEQFTLHQNYPNPFNPVTSLRYDLPEDGLVNITIYDMMGRIVKTLVNSSQTAGFKAVQWNANNDRNEPVSAGLYLYMIQAGEFRSTKKMVLLK